MQTQRQSSSGGRAERTVVLTVRDDAKLDVDATGAAHATVLTPNERAAKAQGVPWVSLETLANGLLQGSGRQRATELARRRALRWAVARVWHGDDAAGLEGGPRDRLPDAAAPNRAAPDAAAPDGAAPIDVEGVARAVEGSVREVLRAGIEEISAEPATPRLRQVVALARAYREALAADALIDPAEVPWSVARAARRGGGVEGRRLRVVGYAGLDPDEIAFVDAVSGPGSTVVLPVAGFDPTAPARQTAKRLAALGWRLEQALEDAPPTADAWYAAHAAALPGGAHGYHFPSQDAEVRFVLTEVKRLLVAGTPADDIALVARDEAAYGPHLEAVAWEYGVPLGAAYRIPLARTRAGAWTLALLQAVVAGLPFEETARVLAHPWSGGFEPQAWVEARATHPRRRSTWRSIDLRVERLSWPPSATRAAYVERLARTLDDFGVDDRPAAPADLEALQQLREAVATLADPGAEGGTPVPLRVFVDEVGDLLRLLHAPRPGRGTGDGPPVPLCPPLALLGAKVRHVFVLGAAEGVLPARVMDDAVLDFHERAAAADIDLPLESAAAAAQREATAIEAVVRATQERLTLTVPEVLGRAALIPSPTFAALGIAPREAPRKAPASLEELRRARLLAGVPATGVPSAELPPAELPRVGSPSAGLSLPADPALAAAMHARAVEARRESARPPDVHDGVVGQPFASERHGFSATQLLSLGQCGFRWLASVPWKLRAPEEAEDDLTPLLRGLLYHEALELALRAARERLRHVGASSDPRAAFRDAALAALDDAFQRAERSVGAIHTPNWEARRDEHLRQLRRVVRAESFLPEGAEVHRLETSFGGRGDERVTWKGFDVRGRIDRIDRQRDGIVLIDYKTSGSKPKGVQDDAGKANLDVQLPLYQQAAAPALFPGEPVAAGRYYSLTKAEVIQEVVVDTELDAALERFAARVRAMLETGTYPVLPDVDRAACAYCDLDLVCRVGPRTERMRAEAEDRAWAQAHPAGHDVDEARP